MEKIKSRYILKNLFSYLDNKIKFQIVLYNKNMQKSLGLTFLDYKRISGKYIIGDRNGKGNEYNYKDELLFEGEYLNGKKHKGKEYGEYNKLEYEGEYLNGKRHGKGKEYNYFGVLIFEGEYLNGKKME